MRRRKGEKRTVYELEAGEVGVCLRSATAKVAKVTHADDPGGLASGYRAGGAAGDRPGRGLQPHRRGQGGMAGEGTPGARVGAQCQVSVGVAIVHVADLPVGQLS
jgi:hypothetical protein